MTTGHEEEFRRLFAAEAATRLSELADQALELEAEGADRELVDAMYRNAHTLKGGAGVVGFADVAALVHELEQLLDDLRAGRRESSSEVADAVLSGVDRLREMIDRAMTGAAAQVTEAIPVPVGRLDALVRLVGQSAAAQLRVGRLLAEQTGTEPGALDEYRELGRLLDQLQAQAMQARAVSVGTVAAPLRRAVRDIAGVHGKRVEFEVAGEDTELDRHVLERLREPLVALIRNAVDHGIETPAERRRAGKPETGRVLVHAMQVGGEVVVSVSDDGRGIDPDLVARALGGERPLTQREALAAIFRPGVTTVEAVTGVSGRGVGLDQVRAAVVDVRGRIDVHSLPGEGTEFRITVPMTLAILRCLLVEAAGQRFAIPMAASIALLDARATATSTVEGRPAVWFGEEAVPQTALAEVLGLQTTARPRSTVVLAVADGRHAFAVERLAGQRDVVVKDLGRVLPRVEVLAGASVEADGSVLLVLDPGGLVRTAAAVPSRQRVEPPALPVRRARILVVDDALTIRELQRSILERAGYEAITAASGDEALRRLAEEDVDLVLTDVEMPGMDGIELTRAVREAQAGRELPVVILSSREDEADRRRGLEAGADRYLVKSAFDERTLLAAVERLLGEHE